VILLVLSLLVVGQRQKHHVQFGDGDVPELARAIRAFGNAAEYIPAGLAALGILAVVGAHYLIVHASGLTLLAGRLSHAIGLSRSTGSSGFRSVGMVLTWVAYILAAVGLLISAFP